jgi:parallel beta-helix repeat protein
MLAKRIIWFSVLAILGWPVPSVFGQTPALYVGGPNANFSSIQAAINAAAEGASIAVQPGTYREQVQVNKRLTLEAKGPVIVDAGRRGSAITLVTSGITLTGFEVRNAGSADKEAGLLILGDGNTVSHIRATANNSGIVVLRGRSNTIADSEISGNRHDGVVIIGASANTVTRNTIANNGRAGVWIQAEHLAQTIQEATENRILANRAHDNHTFGISLHTGANRNEVNDNEVTSNGSSNADAGILINCGPTGNTVQRNKLSANQKHGILVIVGSFANRFLDNDVVGSSTGIGVYAANANEFVSNRVSGSGNFGVHLNNMEPLSGGGAKLPGFPGGTQPVSAQNILHHNNLTTNRVNAFDRSGKTWEPPGAATMSPQILQSMRQALSPNRWDNGAEGNHYDDFDEAREGFVDRNNDGLGENPHPIPGGVAVDHFPLVR